MLKTCAMNLKTDGELQYLTFPLFEKNGVKHAFSTRHGGKSQGEFGSFNTSFDRGDDRDAVLYNMKRLCDAIGADYKSLIYAKQTHTNNVRIVTPEDIGKGIIKERDFDDVDGLISNLPEVALITQYADCVPLLFYDKVKKIIATSHAGWRGTALEIGRVTVLKMKEHFGSNPADIIAGIGPSIGSCCYEVDEPVFSAFSKIGYMPMSEIFTPKAEGKYMLDLKLANKIILMNAGIAPENIDVADICTNCNSEHLHSHRATGGRRGNLGLIISL